MMKLLAGLLALTALTSSCAPASNDTASSDTASKMFEAFNRHDPKALAALYAPDAVITSPDFCKPRGKSDVERTYGALFGAFPDIRDDVQAMISDGEWTAVRFTASSASGKLNLPIHAMIRVRDGLIVEDHSQFDAGGRPCEP